MGQWPRNPHPARAQLALTDPLSCNSLQCPSSHPMLHRHGYVCKLLEFRCVCRVCIYSHTHMQACLFSDWFLWGKPSSQIQLVSLIGSIIVFQMIPSMHVIRTYGNACKCFEPLVRLRCVCVQGFSYSRTQMQGFTARIQAQTVEKNSVGICCVSLLWLAGSIR